MVLSGDTPGASITCISTWRAVMSMTFLAFIFPFSMALVMESCSDAAVLE